MGVDSSDKKAEGTMSHSSFLRADAPAFVPTAIPSQHSNKSKSSPYQRVTDTTTEQNEKGNSSSTNARRRPPRRRRRNTHTKHQNDHDQQTHEHDNNISKEGHYSNQQPQPSTTNQSKSRRNNSRNKNNRDKTTLQGQRWRHTTQDRQSNSNPRRRQRSRKQRDEGAPSMRPHDFGMDYYKSDEAKPINQEEFLSISSFPALSETTTAGVSIDNSQWTGLRSVSSEPLPTSSLVEQIRQQQQAEEESRAQLAASKNLDDSAPTTTLMKLQPKSRTKRLTETISESFEDTLSSEAVPRSAQQQVPSMLSLTNDANDCQNLLRYEEDKVEDPSSTVHPSQYTKCYRRIKLDRLRDSWWKALALRKQRQQVIHELKQNLEPYDKLSSSSEDDASIADSAENDGDEAMASHGGEFLSSNLSAPAGISGSPEKANPEDSLPSQMDLTQEDEGGTVEDELDLWKLARNCREGVSRRGTALDQLVVQWSHKTMAGPSDSLLKSIDRDEVLNDSVSLAIELDLPRTLSRLLPICGKYGANPTSTLTLSTTRRHTPPLLLAASLGRDDMVPIILSYYGDVSSTENKKKTQTIPDILSSQQDGQGNNVFHSCCRGSLSTASTLQLLLDQLSSSSLPAAAGVGSRKLKKQQGVSSKILLATNRRGQTALHCACEHGRIDLVETMLQFLSNESSSSLLPRLLVLRDDARQTPLLAAVTAHSTDVVLTLLLWRVNDYAQHEKQQLMQIEQQQQQEYCRHQQQKLKKHQRNLKDDVKVRPSRLDVATGDYPFGLPPNTTTVASSSCPLVWASKGWNLEMMKLLLEFSDDHVTPYHHTDALYACLMSSGPSHVSRCGFDNDPHDLDVSPQPEESLSSQLDCVQLLIQAGANPFQETPAILWASRGLMESFFFAVENDGSSGWSATTTTTAVGLVAALVGSGRSTADSHNSSVRVLQRVIRTGQHQLREKQLNRRKDPLLRQQPESFFLAMERKEDAELENALSAALVQSLVTGSKQLSTQEDNVGGQQQGYLISAITLYREGAQLRDIDMQRLRLYLANSSTFPDSSIIQPGDNYATALSSAPLDKLNYRPKRTGATAGPKTHTRLLCQMPWMARLLQNELNRLVGGSRLCEKIMFELEDHLQSNERIQEEFDTLFKENDNLVALIARDGTRFEVNSSIVAQSSQKLEAAIRFASMTKYEDETLVSSTSNDDIPEMPVDMDPEYCKFLIQHSYHGSVVVGWSDIGSDDMGSVCRDVLTLLLIAEEFLCPSLVQECERRLLSPVPTACFCKSCVDNLCHDENGCCRDKCSYYVNVAGISRLITPETVLDVLAVAQQLESSSIMDLVENIISPVFPTLKASPSSSSAQVGTKTGKVGGGSDAAAFNALSAVRDACICVILNSFNSVVRSDAYQEHLTYNEEEGEHFDDGEDGVTSPEADADGLVTSVQDQQQAALLLLQMSLEELAVSPFTLAYSNKKKDTKNKPLASAKSS